jgi:signal peptidase II
MTTPSLTPASGAPAVATRDRVFWAILLGIVALDVATKRWAEAALDLHLPQEVLGSWLRWTLTYNTGAAMNLSVGGASRVVFSAIAIGMLVYLFLLYRRTGPNDRATPAALGLIAAGALGNLVDRLRHGTGVVDFIDIGTADWRFWTFNVADVGVTVGALLLAVLLWREDRATAAAVAATRGATHATSGTASNPELSPSTPDQPTTQ